MNNTNIMFTDMVGYSKLTGDDQNLALELLKEHDKIIEPIIKRYNGEIVKRIGDAIVAIFDNSDYIIQSSVEIQQSLKNRNTRNIQDRYIILRIGLHYGEILLKNKEVHGAGYEIASQIEPVCEYGGVAISEALYQQVKESNELIINGAKNHFFIRPIAEFNLKSSSRINIYKLYLNLLDWYDASCHQVHKYLSRQGTPNSIYTPLQVERRKNDLMKHWELAQNFESQHNLSYAIYHYKMYLDYSADLSIDESNYIELIILHIFSQCGLVRLVDRVNKQKLELNNPDLWLHSYIMGINAFNDHNFDYAIDCFNNLSNVPDSKIKLPNYNPYYFFDFYKAIIAWKRNDKDLQRAVNENIISKKDLEHKLLLKVINKLTQNHFNKNEIKALYSEIVENQSINQNAKLFMYWLLIIFYKEHDIKSAIKIQNIANKLIEDLAECISGFQLKQFFIEKPLLHQLLMEEIEFDFVGDEGLDDFAEPERLKTNQLETFNFCIECGFTNKNQFQFCPACGAKLTK